MTTKKYELILDDSITIGERTLFRIRSLVDIPRYAVVAGTVGGYVESEINLSHEGNAWVSGDAKVFGNAHVSENARVFGNALVFGNAHVSGNSKVFGNSYVSGNAQVSGNAIVSGNANIENIADIITVGPALSSGRFTTAHKDKEIGIRVNAAFLGGLVFFCESLEDFASAIERTHKDNQAALRQYRVFHQLIKSNFEI